MKKELLESVLNAHKNLIVERDIASGKSKNVLFPIVDNAIEKKKVYLYWIPKKNI